MQHSTVFKLVSMMLSLSLPSRYVRKMAGCSLPILLQISELLVCFSAIAAQSNAILTLMYFHVQIKQSGLTLGSPLSYNHPDAVSMHDLLMCI